MKEVRNSQGKLVCRLDEKEKAIEIVMKGCVTIIRFNNDGTVKVENTERKPQ